MKRITSNIKFWKTIISKNDHCWQRQPKKKEIVKTLKIDRPLLSDLYDDPVLNAIEKLLQHASVLKLSKRESTLICTPQTRLCFWVFSLNSFISAISHISSIFSQEDCPLDLLLLLSLEARWIGVYFDNRFCWIEVTGEILEVANMLVFLKSSKQKSCLIASPLN